MATQAIAVFLAASVVYAVRETRSRGTLMTPEETPAVQPQLHVEVAGVLGHVDDEVSA